MMAYFRNGEPRNISLETIYIVRDGSGKILGYGGTIATAIMSADSDVDWRAACTVEDQLLNDCKERRF